jgi:flagellin
VKLLDGTYTNKAIQIGTGANQVFRLGVSSTDTNTLGAYEKYSTVEVIAVTADHAKAKAELEAQFVDAADYKVKGAFGEKTANVKAGADARDLARAFNLIAGTTGVNASVITRAQITSVAAAGDLTFTLAGKNEAAGKEATVNVAISSVSDVTALKDAINAVSGKTGITAALTDDLAGVNLVQSDGYNIVIGDMVGSNVTVAGQRKKDDGEIETLGGAGSVTLLTGAKDSTAIVGQVSLSSHKAFTVTPGDAKNHFATDTAVQNSALQAMGSVDVSSQNGANNAISVIDGALAMISETRSEMGAAENRLSSTVDNLSNVSVNTSRSLTSVEDANFASETSALTKSQILQQAATSMLAQANQAKQTMLVLLQG